MPDQRGIPLCRSPFLQDITIALGRRSLKSIRKSNPTLNFEVTEEDIDGVTNERLDIEARSLLGSMTKITMWQDGISWVYFRERNKKDTASPVFEIHANLAQKSIDGIVELIHATLRDFREVQSIWQQHAIPSHL